MRNAVRLRGVAMLAMLTAIAGIPGTAPAKVAARSVKARVGMPPAGFQRPTSEKLLSIGEGELITLPADVADVWVSNPGVADVYVNNARQIHLFGKDSGEATLFATSASGAVIYSTNIRVSQNISSIDGMLKLAMPDANIKVVTMGQIAVLTGTVATPDDSAQAQRLVTALLNPGVNTADPAVALKMGVFNRIRTATPLQVNLQVRIAEVSRSFVKNIGVNVASRDNTGGFTFGVGSGRNPGTISDSDFSKYPIARVPIPGGGYVDGPYDVTSGKLIDPRSTSVSSITNGAGRTTLGLAGKLLGLDLLSAIDLGETIGQVSTLANPNLTALSGETATFLAGGEIPIPISQGLGAVSVEYKQYGISLAYTPTVLADGRISLRVRPEVSQLSSAGAVQINGTTIPALTTRRAETTLELGSGQSMMIAGLMSNSHDNSIDKAPGLGDLPVLGALFRSNGWKRNETELVIIITPYLVKPVNNAADIALPTDGYRSASDLSRILTGNLDGSKGGERRPVPTMAPATTEPNPQPSIGAVAPIVPLPASTPAPARTPAPRDRKNPDRATPVAPGFSN